MRLNKKNLLFFFTAVALLFAPIAAQAVPTQGTTSEEIEDHQITAAIESEFLVEDGVPYHGIDVKTQDGIVTLSGRVHHLLAKERAEMIAETVRGVRGVVNLIEVRPSDRDDTAIRDAVTRALVLDPAADAYELNVSVKNGVVTLTGTVDSWQERELAATVAKSVRGVTGLNDKIDIAYKLNRSDSEIRSEIEQRLRWDIRLDDDAINVAVADGKVTLSGLVGSAAARALARNRAWVGGVKSVEASELEIRPWIRNDKVRMNRTAYRSDEAVTQAIKDAFLYDPRVNMFEVDVEVHNGQVVLSGAVDNLKAKWSATQTARNVVGVWRVKNHIKVRPTDVPSDETLEQQVSAALDRNSYLDRYDSRIRPIAHAGEVYLYGTVDTHYDRFKATDVVAGLHGVVAVNNYLTVDGSDLVYYRDPLLLDHVYDWGDPVVHPFHLSFKEDWEVRDDIESELFWSPFVDADQITVTVDDRVATLSGTVSDWFERGAAIENAYEGGAVKVIDRMKVENAEGYARK